jgi:parallel beta-helix repeat protein
MYPPSIRGRLTRLVPAAALLGTLLLGSLPAAASGVSVCIPTDFVRDTIPLTAARAGGVITGTVDAYPCDIGVYFSPAFPGSVNGAAISGAKYFGVVVDGGSVDVVHSSISNIGDTTLGGDPAFTGGQHGIGVYYTSEHGASSGTVDDNRVSRYQKGGIVATEGATVTITNNTVTGRGPLTDNAQNGIQVSYGASASVSGNSIYNHDYIPRDTIACGLLLFDASGVRTDHNLFRNNEVNTCNFGKGGGSYSPVP